ncbi:MAG: type 4a pilus biogenesis protein PilO [Deltaproteobacteria bacterium]|jgi:type IV pilus assembly protein PilO|nr:type 4a pilus biogenesis protein PilO [Deltaproteobacteria bacterium]
MAKAQTKKADSGDFFTKISKLKSGQKLGILIGSAVAIIVAFYMLYFQPYTDQKTALNSEIATLNTNISTEQTNVNKHKPIAKYVSPVADMYLYLKSFFTTENEIPRLMQIISDLGAQAGIKVILFAPGSKGALLNPEYAEIPFSMNLQGPFLNVLKFLYTLSQMERIINIKTISMDNPVLGDNLQIHLSVKCDGSTYRSLTEEEVKTVSDPKNAKK